MSGVHSPAAHTQPGPANNVAHRVALPLGKTYAVLARIGRASAIATHWLDEAAECLGDTAKTRRFLCRLRTAGLVEGVSYSSGIVRWWALTDAGRKFLVTFADRVAGEPADTQVGIFALRENEQNPPGNTSDGAGVYETRMAFHPETGFGLVVERKAPTPAPAINQQAGGRDE